MLSFFCEHMHLHELLHKPSQRLRVQMKDLYLVTPLVTKLN